MQGYNEKGNFPFPGLLPYLNPSQQQQPLPQLQLQQHQYQQRHQQPQYPFHHPSRTAFIQQNPPPSHPHKHACSSSQQWGTQNTAMPPPPQLPPDQNPGRIVFVGNIPYGLTEEQISDIFSNVGRVVSFRLVYDRESGRPKGFGFAEYQDPETAASAVRNLNNYDIMGRKLRVDFSHEEAAEFENATAYHPDGGSGSGSGGAGGQSNMLNNPPPPIPPGALLPNPANPTALPPLPPGVEPPPNLSAPDAISRTLSGLPPGQLLDVIAQMKQLVQVEPLRAGELLRQAPQLAYAIFQALLLMNLVDTSVLSQVIESSAQQGARPPTQQQAPPPPLPQQQAYQPPPQQQQQPVQQQGGQQSIQDAEKARLIQQVLSMTNEQIMALPQEQRGAILILRQQLMSGAQL